MKFWPIGLDEYAAYCMPKITFWFRPDIFQEFFKFLKNDPKIPASWIRCPNSLVRIFYLLAF